MCTAVSYGGCFGRNLDVDREYGEQLVLMPRNFSFPLRRAAAPERHYAVAGMARVEGGVPLYFDGMNEKGLAMAGLNFPGYAVYFPDHAGAENVTPFELIPYVLGRCADVKQAGALLAGVNVLDQNFSPELPLTPLHWMAADRTGAIVIESVGEGLRIYDAPEGVLTNAPDFEEQLAGLKKCGELPGDLSSRSRFVRAAFFRKNSPAGLREEERVSQLFRILDSVAQPKGAGRQRTVYSACCDLNRGFYCCRTEENSRLTGVALEGEVLDGKELVTWPVRREQDILWENAGS